MRDQRTEQWLASFKLEFEYHDALPLVSVTVDSAAKANIRMTERIDEDLVMRYAVALENRTDFPGIVVFRDGDRYGVINGWHRVEAYRYSDRAIIPAYVVAVTDKLLIGVLRRTANTLEGKPPSTAEMLEQAAFLVKQGYTVTDAARLMSVQGKRLSDRVQLDRVYARLAGQRVEPGELRIPTTAMVRLDGLRDAHIGPVALLAHEARLTGDRVMELTRQVREAGTDADAAAVIADWRRQYGAQIQRNRGGTVRDPASGLRRLPVVLRQTERRLAAQRDRAATLGEDEVKVLVAACRRAIRELEAMVAHLEAARG